MARPAPGTPAIFTRKPIRSLADMNGQARLRLADRGPLPQPLRRRPGDRPLGGRRGRAADGRARRRRLVRLHRGLRGGLGGHLQYFLTNNISGAWIGTYFANMESWNEGARAPAATVPPPARPVALLPAALVLGRRGEAPRQRRQAGADLDPDEEWAQVVAGRPSSGTRSRRSRAQGPQVVEIFKDYNAIHGEGGALPLPLTWHGKHRTADRLCPAARADDATMGRKDEGRDAGE
jgi:hypothetical protein